MAVSEGARSPEPTRNLLIIADLNSRSSSRMCLRMMARVVHFQASVCAKNTRTVEALLNQSESKSGSISGLEFKTTH